MPYEKREWIAKVTPLSADNFNHMENGIEAAANAAAENAKNHSDFKSEMATQIDALEEQLNAAEVRDAEFAQQSNEKHDTFNERLEAVEQEVPKIPPAAEPYKLLVADASGTAKWADGGYVKARITTDDIVWDKSASTPGTSEAPFTNGVSGRYIKVSSYVPLKEDALSSDAVWTDVDTNTSYDFDGAYGVGAHTYPYECVFTPDGKIPKCMVVAKPFKFIVDSSGKLYFDFWETGIYMFAKSSTSTHKGKLSCLCNVPTSEGSIPFVQTASVGQTIVVKSVDENGKPTEWEAVDTGGSGGGNIVTYYPEGPHLYHDAACTIAVTRNDVLGVIDNAVFRIGNTGNGLWQSVTHIEDTGEYIRLFVIGLDPDAVTLGGLCTAEWVDPVS